LRFFSVKVGVSFLVSLMVISPFLILVGVLAAVMGGGKEKVRLFSSSVVRFMQKFSLGRLKLIVSLQEEGVFLVRPFSGDIMVLKEIFFDEVYEAFYELKRGDVVVDVGAHIGCFTVKASRTVGASGLVVSVEPEPENYRMLLTNISLNSLGNVTPLRVALADRRGVARLFKSDDYIGHSIVAQPTGDFVPVPVTTLDELLRELNVGKVDFIKIDAEGAEALILKGAMKTIIEHRPALAIATYHYTGETAEVANILKRLNFKVAILEDYVYAAPSN